MPLTKRSKPPCKAWLGQSTARFALGCLPFNSALEAMKSKYDPTEEEESSADLILHLLVHRQSIIRSNQSNNSYEKQFKELVDTLLWKHTEAHGKYIGCKYWSNGALESLKKHNNKVVTNKKIDPTHALRHEHIFPKNESIKLLLNIDTPTPEKVNEILKQNIGVVVTVEEDSRLSKNGNFDDPWQRYRDANISWQEKK